MDVLLEAFGVGTVKVAVAIPPSVSLPFDMFGSRSLMSNESIKTPAGLER